MTEHKRLGSEEFANGEIYQAFEEMGLASEDERQNLLNSWLASSQPSEPPMLWIEASSGTSSWEEAKEQRNAKLE